MEKKLQVFISSTYIDLKDERQTAVEAILNEGHIPAGMELFKAGPSQEEVISEWIEQSDIYMLILGSRYGSLNDQNISYTEWEYDLACKLNKPMFSIVLSEDYINQQVAEGKVKATDLETNNDKYREFHNKVTDNLVKFISNTAEITIGISGSIREIEKKNKNTLVGWIPGKYEEELSELRMKNQKLNEDLLTRQTQFIEIQKELQDFKDEYIGEYGFNFIVNELKKMYIPTLDIAQELKEQKNLQEMYIDAEQFDEAADQVSIISKLEKLLKSSNIYDSLTKQLHRILERGLLQEIDSYDKFIMNHLFEPLKRFSLVEGSGYRRASITESGFKFLNILNFKLDERAD